MTTNKEGNKIRLVARTSTEIQEIIQRAADHCGVTLSQFLLDAALDKARTVIERTETLHTSMANADVIFDALAASGDAEKGLASLDKLDASFEGK